MHQNVSKSKNRAAKTVYGLILLPIYGIIDSFFFVFFYCAIIGRNLSKKCKLPLYQTQTG